MGIYVRVYCVWLYALLRWCFAHLYGLLYALGCDMYVQATTAAAAAASGRTDAGASLSSSGVRATDAMLRKQSHCLAELEGLQLCYQPTWLLSMVGGDASLESYAHATVFLLQIQLAKQVGYAAPERPGMLMFTHSHV